jgi:hypothetical protein
MSSEKIRAHHLDRKAILYIRQSSAHQVLHNRESSALQNAMRDRLTALGWSEIEVIDDALGGSAAGGVQRAGFEGMVAQLCLGKVGAVAAREVSRFARDSRDAVKLLHVTSKTHRSATEAGEIEAVHPLPDGPWIFSRAALSTPTAPTITERARLNDIHRWVL